jgi:hypothetical protein
MGGLSDRVWPPILPDMGGLVSGGVRRPADASHHLSVYFLWGGPACVNFLEDLRDPFDPVDEIDDP